MNPKNKSDSININIYFFAGRYEQAPSHRLQKYPSQGQQGPPSHIQGPPNHHQQSQPHPNYGNNYVPQQQMQHQQNNYYGQQGKFMTLLLKSNVVSGTFKSLL